MKHVKLIILNENGHIKLVIKIEWLPWSSECSWSTH